MNDDMGFDPRAIANAMLDLADTMQLELSNLTLNKVLFFAHGIWLTQLKRRLSSLSFEAWQYGPVVPLIYHQFKNYGEHPISGRATRIDLDTGEDIIVDYAHLDLDLPLLGTVVREYGSYAPGKLIQLSHITGGPWHTVWNASDGRKFGMVIPDSLIANSFRIPTAGRGGQRVH